jgi:hypothetical protein
LPCKSLATNISFPRKPDTSILLLGT